MFLSNFSGFLSPLRSSGINNVTGLTQYGSNYSPQLANDPLLSGSTPKGKVRTLNSRSMIGIIPLVSKNNMSTYYAPKIFHFIGDAYGRSGRGLPYQVPGTNC